MIEADDFGRTGERHLSCPDVVGLAKEALPANLVSGTKQGIESTRLWVPINSAYVAWFV